MRLLRSTCGYFLMFSAILITRDNFCDFLLAYLDDKTLQNGVFTYGKEFAPREAII